MNLFTVNTVIARYDAPTIHVDLAIQINILCRKGQLMYKLRYDT